MFANLIIFRRPTDPVNTLPLSKYPFDHLLLPLYSSPSHLSPSLFSLPLYSLPSLFPPLSVFSPSYALTLSTLPSSFSLCLHLPLLYTSSRLLNDQQPWSTETDRLWTAPQTW